MFGLLQRQFLSRIGSRAALAALALHLVLSFAHVHQPQMVAQADIVVSEESGLPAPLPLGPAVSDDCAICANIAAFSSLDLPTPVPVMINASWVTYAVPMLSGWTARSADYHLFRSRAPPIA